MLAIRKATIDNLKDITKIYNESIEKTVATFDTEKMTIKQQKSWFKDHGPKNPIIVAEEDGVIVGWAALSKYSSRPAYSDTAEISLYVKEKYQGKGFGTKLMKAINEEGEKAGLHASIARITDGNKVSIKLHEDAGFRRIGVMKEVGKKFGKLLDVHIMQKIYKP